MTFEKTPGWLDWFAGPSAPTFRVPPGSVDAHCHVFGPGAEFPFAAERKYTPCDASKAQLFALRDHLGFARNVVVQATCHGADNAALRDQHAGKKYNTAGIVLQAPFSIGRQYCELPLIPGLVRDYCIRRLAVIQLGAVMNDRFFCSQFVLEAYRHARLPLTTADPRLISPADLLHMREGDVPSVRTEQALQYVGHLKTAPMPSDEMAVGLAD